jgi:peptidyl-prolyl cis-trans isomerase B (cyclophilin B)
MKVRTSLSCLLFSLGLACSQLALADSAPTTLVHLKTNMGTITLALDAQKSPKTVANFLQYVKDGFYNNTVFHRVIPDYMAQAGGYDVQRNKKATHYPPVPNEANNGLKNLKGTVAMARRSGADSATSQFYINLQDNPDLDHTAKTAPGWGYAVFGKILQGEEVLDAIQNLETEQEGTFKHMPTPAVVIEKITVENAAKTTEATADSAAAEQANPDESLADETSDDTNDDTTAVVDEEPAADANEEADAVETADDEAAVSDSEDADAATSDAEAEVATDAEASTTKTPSKPSKPSPAKPVVATKPATPAKPSSTASHPATVQHSAKTLPEPPDVPAVE